MLFLVKRLDDTGYDEYEEFVIRAKSFEEAHQIARKKSTDFKDISNLSIMEIEIEGKSEIILDSFNAG